MYYLIETEEQVNQFISKQYKEAFIHIIPFHNEIHPVLNKLSLLYIKPYNEKGFIIPYTHNEAINVCNTVITRILQSIETLYTLDKINLFYYLGDQYNSKVFNIKKEDININFSIYNYYYNQYNLNYINTFIPISKHYEYCEQLYENIKNNLVKNSNIYNDLAYYVFYNIEKNGIKINEKIFDKFFHINKKYSINNDIIYTKYNLNNITKRPSNSFNHINFLALNKHNGCRTSFIPKNDIFIEADITAYHPTLISHLIDYKFDTSNIHEHFQQLYNVSYDEAKEITFRQLYGNIQEEYKNLEFFVKTQNYIDKCWNIYINNNNKFITDSNILLTGDLNKNKLFNYIIQEKETSNNILIINDLINLLKNKQSQLVLYVYDSFVIDYKKEDNLIEDIKNIFNKYNLNIKLKEKVTL